MKTKVDPAQPAEGQPADGRAAGRAAETAAPAGDRATTPASDARTPRPAGGRTPFAAVSDAYRQALEQMALGAQKACPAVSAGLERKLVRAASELTGSLTVAQAETSEKRVREALTEWGQAASGHYREKAREVKELLLTMAGAAEAVGDRDRRYADQLTDVTTHLAKVADLEDLTEMRASIEQSAREMKTSIERMTAEGSASIAQLRAEVTSYQTRLEEAEEQASRDALTGVRNRQWMEAQMEADLGAGRGFCVAVADLDGFKGVNDTMGHAAGDELLRIFANALVAACPEGALAGRWGGDEFVLLLVSSLEEAQSEIERIREAVCGYYTIEGQVEKTKLLLEASFGVAEAKQGETCRELLQRADEAMYRDKGQSAARRGRSGQRSHGR